MFNRFLQNIEEKIQLTVGEHAKLQAWFKPRKLRKKQYLLQEGDVCRNMYFTNKGLLRMYSVDDKGLEHMMQFAIEGWWMVDVYSFFTHTPSRYNIDALEDSELLYIAQDSFEDMMTAIPKMERYFRLLYQNNIISKERRLESSIFHSAEVRYQHFLDKNPTLIHRIPLTLVASYLGITPETLSRIRRNLSTQKPDSPNN